MSDVHYDIGERARYAECGKAMRQAQRRLVALISPVATDADVRAFLAVCCLTVAYSKLDDHVSQAQVAELARLSSRQTRRSLRRLAERDVIIFQPGRGAGVLTVIGVPPEGVKADDYQAALGLKPVSAFTPPKADKLNARKSGHPTRAHVNREAEKNKGLSLEERLDPTPLCNSSEEQEALFTVTPPRRGAYSEPDS